VLQFTDTEAFIAAGEELLTPYVWTRYDILCLPPSFPYGGMGAFLVVTPRVVTLVWPSFSLRASVAVIVTVALFLCVCDVQRCDGLDTCRGRCACLPRRHALRRCCSLLTVPRVCLWHCRTLA
jgi:hypothetical protein